MIEKRKLERFELSVPARIQGEENRNILELATRDVCASGAFFHTDRSLPEGTKVRIDLLLPLERLKSFLEGYDHAHVSLTGKVSRIEPRGMAICFDNNYSIRPQKGKSALWH
jgi:hypothetical protein